MEILLKTAAYCLVMTILLEMAFALFVGIRGRKNLLIVLLVQVLTNPCAVFGMVWFMSRTNVHYVVYELLIESLVVIVEWLIYRKMIKDLKRPLAFSLAANYFSYSFGIVLGYYGISI